MKRFASHGNGRWDRTQFASLGNDVVIEAGVLVFHPENITLGDNVYVGHQTILKGYWKNRLEVGADTWIGQQCFLHSAGGIVLGRGVGVGPGVRILTSRHMDPWPEPTIMEGAIEFGAVEIGDGSDLGVGATILPGVRIGRGVQVGAGAVVAQDVPNFVVVAGVPARVLRHRGDEVR